jgi:AraC-like DNA-binding protein
MPLRLAVLPPESIARLRRLLPTSVSISAMTPLEAMQSLGSTVGGSLLLDPTALLQATTARLMDLANANGVKVVVYVALTGIASARICALAATRSFELAIVGEESPWLLELIRAVDPSAVSLAFRELAGRVAMLPEPLRTEIVRLFGGDGRSTQVGDIYRRLPIAASTALDWLHAQGLPSFVLLVGGIRLAHSWPALADSNHTLIEVAESCGFGSERALRENCVRLTGFPPRSAARRLTQSEFSQRIIRALMNSHE